MDFLPFHAEDRKPGVDYVRCQKEFEIQMLLLQQDIQNRFGWNQQRGDGYGPFRRVHHKSGPEKHSRSLASGLKQGATVTSAT
ncbi:hypothetical protein HYE67_001297 [Fusarium culmorum]|uniref:Uncharacterized protein n=1 Tax=Fusarium culmorum TaxID=5516 RepID=A0A2T4GXT0_FUSCU|nr:hypothetical protein FCULG_00005426 [Fusarium culmorum]QPC59066.1 hypothetical protein HYE67_001297 [Fusarium culmorum]